MIPHAQSPEKCTITLTLRCLLNFAHHRGLRVLQPETSSISQASLTLHVPN